MRGTNSNFLTVRPKTQTLRQNIIVAISNSRSSTLPPTSEFTLITIGLDLSKSNHFKNPVVEGSAEDDKECMSFTD